MAISNDPLYTPTPPTIGPQTEDGRNIVDWMQRELHKLSTSLSEITRLQLGVISKAPVTPRDGLIEIADGINWAPLRFIQSPVNENFVGYRAGGWVPMDLGKVWEATDVGFLSGKSTTTSGQPVIDMVNDFNDAASPNILIAKSRGGGANSLNGDSLLTIIGYGTVSTVHQPSASLLFQQGGASVGNNIPRILKFKRAMFSASFTINFFFKMEGG